jgi:hypothetical protein
MPIVNPKRWVRVPKVKSLVSPPPPEYDYEVVRQSLQAAAAVHRYDIAQQIAEEAKSDLCIICAKALATNTVLHDPPVANQQALMQLCDDCAAEYRG